MRPKHSQTYPLHPVVKTQNTHIGALTRTQNAASAVLLFIIMLMIAAGCSTKKNTAMRRAYHATATRFNIMYNGQLAYNQGLDAIDKANVDNYTRVLPMYTSSNHEALSAGKSDMERALEKCRKSIKLHSIQKKPKMDTKKSRDPKYRAWYEQEEFNRALYLAWLMQGKAEFHTGDFLGCVTTMNYVARHYANNRDVVAQAQLWAVRAYLEMGWIYEAEDLLKKVNQDELKRKNAWLYSAVSADMLLRKEDYKAAIPYLNIASKNEKRRIDRTRMTFILGQISERQNDKSTAIDCYTRVIKAFNTVDMEFNARMRRAILQGDDKALKDLTRMTRDFKNREHLEQVYGAIGNIYLLRGDTATALKNFRTAIDTCKTAGAAKLEVLLTAADLYYQRQDYHNAEPCYNEAASLMSATDKDYERVSNRSQALGNLIAEYDKAHLQDSLQQLASLSEDEQRAVIKQMIEDMQTAAFEAQQRAEQQARDEENSGLMSVNNSNMLGGSVAGEWYFYNASLLRQGKQEFIKKWGKRKLEDDWRHMQKTMVAFGDDDTDDDSPDMADDGSAATADSTATAAVSDPNSVEFYLQQIPSTPEQIEASNREWAQALYNMGYVYLDEIEDRPMAIKTFDELLERFPQSAHTLDTYYTLYITALRDSNNAVAETWRQRIVSEFPDSRQGQMLAIPDYTERLAHMLEEQDSVYERTYNAYRRGDYNEVRKNVNYARDNYAMSELMPKFLFINSLTTAKTGTREAFGDDLRELIELYPQAEVSAMAKDMLALMGQGLENQHGEGHGSLIEKHEEELAETKQEDDKGFSDEIDTRFVLLIIMDKNTDDKAEPEDTDNERLNKLLYQVAVYNFSQFLIKDFDLTALSSVDDTHCALSVSGLDSYRELVWYVEQITSDNDLRALFDQLNARPVSISETNLQTLRQGHTLEEYEAFWKEILEQ